VGHGRSGAGPHVRKHAPDDEVERRVGLVLGALRWPQRVGHRERVQGQSLSQNGDRLGCALDVNVNPENPRLLWLVGR
jgi:hypothetical protein